MIAPWPRTHLRGARLASGAGRSDVCCPAAGRCAGTGKKQAAARGSGRRGGERRQGAWCPAKAGCEERRECGRRRGAFALPPSRFLTPKISHDGSSAARTYAHLHQQYSNSCTSAPARNRSSHKPPPQQRPRLTTDSPPGWPPPCPPPARCRCAHARCHAACTAAAAAQAAATASNAAGRARAGLPAPATRRRCLPAASAPVTTFAAQRWPMAEGLPPSSSCLAPGARRPRYAACRPPTPGAPLNLRPAFVAGWLQAAGVQALQGLQQRQDAGHQGPRRGRRCRHPRGRALRHRARPFLPHRHGGLPGGLLHQRTRRRGAQGAKTDSSTSQGLQIGLQKTLLLLLDTPTGWTARERCGPPLCPLLRLVAAVWAQHAAAIESPRLAPSPPPPSPHSPPLPSRSASRAAWPCSASRLAWVPSWAASSPSWSSWPGTGALWASLRCCCSWAPSCPSSPRVGGAAGRCCAVALPLPPPLERESCGAGAGVRSQQQLASSAGVGLVASGRQAHSAPVAGAGSRRPARLPGATATPPPRLP
jgi:hypothetical protein